MQGTFFLRSRTVSKIRKFPGVIHADALFGSPDVVAIVKGKDIATMDAVIDRIAAVCGAPEAVNRNSTVERTLAICLGTAYLERKARTSFLWPRTRGDETPQL
jgi:hypothetical protein